MASSSDAHRKRRMDCSDDLVILRDLLWKHDVCRDPSPLNDAISQARSTPRRVGSRAGMAPKWPFEWGYRIEQLRLEIEELRHVRPRGSLGSNLDSVVTIDFKEYLPEEAERTYDCDEPLGGLTSTTKVLEVQFELESLCDREDGNDDLLSAWHYDTHPVGQVGREAHPRFHIQVGGEAYDECDARIRAVLLPEAPRVAAPPMDGILALNFLLSNYCGELWRRLSTDSVYQGLVTRAMKRWWRPYFEEINRFLNAETVGDSKARLLMPSLLPYDPGIE